MDLRQKEIIKELRKLKSLSTNYGYHFCMTIREKEFRVRKSKRSLLPVLSLHYNASQIENEDFVLLIQFLDESMNNRIAEKRFNSLVNSALAKKLGIPDKDYGYQSQFVKTNLSKDIFKNEEDISKILLELCQLFSEKEDIEFECTFNLFLDFNKSLNNLILPNMSVESKTLEDAIESTIQKLLFHGYSKSLEIFKDSEKEHLVQTIIFTADENNENFSIDLHTLPFDNTELEKVFARINKFELIEYTTKIEVYDNAIYIRLDLTFKNLFFCKYFIPKYLKVLFPIIDINSLQSEIIDFSEI